MPAIEALRVFGKNLKVWWLDRVYEDWYGEPATSSATGWRVLVNRPGMRLLSFLVIGLLIGLIFRSKDEGIIVNMIFAIIGALLGGFGFDAFFTGFLEIHFYGPYATLVASSIGAIVVVFIKRFFI